MLAHQDSIRAAIERIDMRLAETLEQHASLLKADQENRSVIVDSPEKLGRSKDEREATNLSDLPRGNDIEKGVADQLINIDHAAELYESVSEGVKNFKERVIAFRQTLNEGEKEEFMKRTNDALDLIIANAELADQYSPEELKEIRDSFTRDESLSFFIAAVEEGVLGQMLLESDHAGAGAVTSGIEIQHRNE